MINNNTDYPISVDVMVDAAPHHWVVPRYDNAWQVLQLSGPISGAALTVYQPDTCTVAYQGDLPTVSSVVSIDPGLPTGQEPFSREVRVQVGAKASLAADDKDVARIGRLSEPLAHMNFTDAERGRP